MKYLSAKVIKGKTYYYLQYRGYSKSLGTSLPENLKDHFIGFFIDVFDKEYLKLPFSVKKAFRFGDLKALEEQHYFYICLKSGLFAKSYSGHLLSFIILFTYHSNSQEGSDVTRKEVEDFAKSRIRKPKTKTDKEIKNSFDAFDYATSDEMRWNMKHIKKVHFLLLQEIDPLIAGQWKKENNTAPGNQPTSDWKDVPKKMQSLLSWLNTELKKKNVYPPILALHFYSRFEAIHPFLDGNGRVGRILLNAILHKFDYPFVIFFSENKTQHSDAIQQSLEGRWTKMYKHFLDQVKKTEGELHSDLKTMLLKLKK